MFKLEYSVTRPISFRHFATAVVLFQLIWLIFITIINIVAVGYETVSVSSTVYNSSGRLWYERFVPTFWLSQSSRSCDGSVIPLNGGLATSQHAYEYTLRAYYDGRNDTPIDGMLYEDYSIINCSVQLIELSQVLWSPAVDTEWIGCNTSAAQFFEASTTRNLGWLTSNFAYGFGNGSFVLPTNDLNITWAGTWWSEVLLALSEYVAPLEKPSLLHPSLVAGGLSSLRFGYYDWNLTSNDVLPTNNTPAGDYWTLWLIYEPQNSTPPMEYAIPITFLPTGEIDTTRTSEQDMSRANSILAPTIQILQSVIPGFDFWKLANWIFVSWANCSPLSTGYYEVGSPVPIPNTTASPVFYPPTNNIFVNDTLFQIYSSYMLDTLIPTTNQKPQLNFLPLDDTNRIIEVDTYFLRTYSCLERRWKGPLSAIISVLVADYALVLGPYTLIILVASFIQKRRENDGNYCQGCLGKGPNASIEACESVDNGGSNGSSERVDPNTPVPVRRRTK